MSEVIETTGTVVAEGPAPVAVQPATTIPAPSIKSLTVADINAMIRKLLTSGGEDAPEDEEGYGLTAEQVSKIEQLGSYDIGGEKWVVGNSTPNNEAFLVLGLYTGDDNERIADHMQGDLRAYIVPLTVVQPGAREYRRVTVNKIVAKQTVHRMTLDAFVEAVAYEEMSVAERIGLIEEPDDEPEGAN